LFSHSISGASLRTSDKTREREL